MSTIVYHYLNIGTRKLCANDTILCKEVGGSHNTRAVPFFIEKEMHTLIVGSKRNFTEKNAIKWFKKLTGIEIEEKS